MAAVPDSPLFCHGPLNAVLPFTFFFAGTLSHVLLSFLTFPFLSFLSYIGYAKDQIVKEMSPKQESLMALFALAQSVLLGSFAAILAAHRSEILDQPSNAVMDMMDEMHGIDRNSSSQDNSYTAPSK